MFPSLESLPAVTRARLSAGVERAKRVLARRNFYEFVKQAWHVVEPERPFSDNWHILALCNHLQAVTEGKIDNIIFNVPPGTMKSLLVCVFWPAWEWIEQPGLRHMSGSYAEPLSLRDAVRTRDLVLSEWYQSRWPLVLRADVNAKGRYENSKGGWRLVCSVGGKGIGEHPDRLIIDDPHNVVDMESEAERQAVVNWLDGMVSSRGVTRGIKRVMVMQRLHTQDASGYLLEKRDDKGKPIWEHVCFPMRFEVPVKDEKTGISVPRMPRTSIGFQDPRVQDGELLWPELYTADRVVIMEINMGPYHAAGQLQQRPTPRGGGKFKRGWFEVLPALPVLIQSVRYWDKAGTSGGKGARTAGVFIAAYHDASVLASSPFFRKYIIIDAQGHRVEAAEREKIIKNQTVSDRATHPSVVTWVEQEPGSGGKESAEGTIANLAGFAVMADKVTGSKEVRADPLASQASVGKIKLLAGPWNKEFLDEVELFPLGKLKDLVDAAGGGFNKIFQPTAFTSAEWVTVSPAAPDDRQWFEPDRLDL